MEIGCPFRATIEYYLITQGVAIGLGYKGLSAHQKKPLHQNI
jgi:hypothetical protein